MTMQWKDEPMTTCDETPERDETPRQQAQRVGPEVGPIPFTKEQPPNDGGPWPFTGDRDSVNAPGNSEDTADQAMKAAHTERQKKITTLMRSALGHIEDAVDLAPDYTPEGVQLRQFAATLDNLATDIERRAR